MGSIQEVIAPVDHLVFDVELSLENQTGAMLLPFRGMDKTGKSVCVYFDTKTCSGCELMELCPYRHIVGEKGVVCKHWLRGLCKKGDECEFLHEYDLTRMPECFFYAKYNACNNKDCPFRHIDPESRIKDCPWYDRGFCRHGPNCKSRHRRRLLCVHYLNGFCPKGPECKMTHPSFDLPKIEHITETRPIGSRGLVTCHNCYQRGHKASNCPQMPSTNTSVDAQRNQIMGAPRTRAIIQQQESQPRQPLSEITCYKCGEKGHFANRCTSSGRSFLSQR